MDHDPESSPGAPSAFDWGTRYTEANTPWDLGAPHPELSQRLSSGDLAPPRTGARVLVPGAGRGHDAVALARRGWAVTAVEIVPGVAAPIVPELVKRGGGLIEGDIFDVELGGPFELVWDHTFFCAIPLERRAEWGVLARECTARGSRYVSLIFPYKKPAESGGPPHGMDAEAVGDALGSAYEREWERAVARPVAQRTWPERIASFLRV